MIGQLAVRIAAVFAYSAMALVGGSAIVGGIPVWKAAVLAGISATAQVLEKLARAYADDGKITRDEIDAAFQLSRPPRNEPYDYNSEVRA